MPNINKLKNAKITLKIFNNCKSFLVDSVFLNIFRSL